MFYWPGAHFDSALLIQAFCNIVMQVILLKIALDHRPAPSSKGGEAALPFTGAHGVQDGLGGLQRPYNFWQWRSPKPYVRTTRNTHCLVAWRTPETDTTPRAGTGNF